MVDFHTHYMPRSLDGYRAAGCVRLEIASPSCAQLYDGERHYRKIDNRSWDATRRLGDMDARAIAMQVLSPIPVTNAYLAAPADGLEYARLHNGIGAVVRERPDRFAGLAIVPLQDVDAACGELERLVRDVGLLGVEIGTTAAGRELDDPALTPFWERCDALAAIVFIHPESAPGFDRLRTNGLVVSVGYPSETGAVAATLIASGMVRRYPNVAIVLAHGGGTLPWLLPRLDRLWEKMPALRTACPQRPSVVARSLYCDTLTFDTANLTLVAQRFGVDRLLIGSDYPFSIMEDPPGAALDGARFDSQTEAAIRGGTFRRLIEERFA